MQKKLKNDDRSVRVQLFFLENKHGHLHLIMFILFIRKVLLFWFCIVPYCFIANESMIKNHQKPRVFQNKCREYLRCSLQSKSLFLETSLFWVFSNWVSAEFLKCCVSVLWAVSIKILTPCPVLWSSCPKLIQHKSKLLRTRGKWENICL